MQTFNIKSKTQKSILALGAESAGNFSCFHKGKIYLSSDFGDLLDEKNLSNYKSELLGLLKNKDIKPDIILTDLHPLYLSTELGKNLAKTYKAKYQQIQHHIAHSFSALGEYYLKDNKAIKNFYSLAMDGTGLGLDDNIWGGEVFYIDNGDIKRIGHLENQTLIGADLAIREPARILISILNNFLDKDKIFDIVKKYYSKNEFNLIYNQLQQNFNCLKTSSTGRIMDASSLLLGFCENTRKYKHEPIDLLEKNSSHPYDIEPSIKYIKSEETYILQTTHLFEFLINNLKKDKKRLAATVQTYLAQGFYEIIKKNQTNKKAPAFFAGGLAQNKIISDYLTSKGFISSNIIPSGDAGISFGQIFYYLSTNPRD